MAEVVETFCGGRKVDFFPEGDGVVASDDGQDDVLDRAAVGCRGEVGFPSRVTPVARR
ncbi:hypothetical protein [Cryobacterium sp. TMB3-10]|uniref:hypothetical protein n=1 Tax=Cryobacterium sp. TMB3-10 TaxID=1259209 RepID=UPI00141ABD05|nr:hypothetical protein [Cryobacterium sp. TMB3-10]